MNNRDAWPLAVIALVASMMAGCKGSSPERRSDTKSSLGPESSAVLPTLDQGWCGGHGVPESVCTRCNDSLIAKFKEARDWCAEHGLPESQCVKCHPDVADRWAALDPANQKKGDLEASEPRANAGMAGSTGVRKTSLTPLSRAGNEKRAALPPSPSCSKSNSEVRLKSPEWARVADFEFVRIEEQPLTASVGRNAEVVYNANRYARLSPRASGVIAEVRRDLGEAVTSGDVLAIVNSAELGSAKAGLLQAAAAVQLWQKSANRERSLADRGIGKESEAQEAETKLAEAQIGHAGAKQRLRNLGLADEAIAVVEQSQDTSSRLEVLAPFDGLVIERSAVLGEVVELTSVLFAVADPTTLWAMVDLFESDVPTVAVGQDVIFALESVPDRTFSGRISWISTHLDSLTRTLKARAEIANDDGFLRANTFGRVQIAVRRGEHALLVPKEAVQWDGCCNLVFLKTDNDGTTFKPSKVHLGLDTGAGYEALSGVQSGDVVVTSGSYLLKTEILKGSIGAGCCDHAVKELSK